MKQRLPIIELNPSTLATALKFRSGGTPMTLFKEDESTSLVDGVDYNAAGSTLTPNAQGLIEIDMLITQVVTVKDSSTILYKAIIEGDNARTEEMADGRIVTGFNFKLNSGGTEIQVLANGTDGAFAIVYFATDFTSHSIYAAYGTVVASTRIDTTTFLESPMRKIQLTNGQRFFGFNVYADFVANEIKAIANGDAWAWVFDDTNNDFIRYHVLGASLDDKINLAVNRIDYAAKIVLSDGREAKGYNIVLAGAGADEIESLANGAAYAEIFDPTTDEVKTYNIDSSSSAGERLDLSEHESAVAKQFTLSDGRIAKGYNIVKKSTDDQILTAANGSAFAEIQDITADDTIIYATDTTTVAGVRLDVAAKIVEKVFDDRKVVLKPLFIGNEDSAAVLSENARIEMAELDNTNAATLSMAVGANDTDTSNFVLSFHPTFGMQFVNSKRNAGVLQDITWITGGADWILVHKTFATVAAAIASGDPSGTHYKITTGDDEAKSIVRSIP